MTAWLSDFVSNVHAALPGTRGRPTEKVLRSLLETMYFASLRTEEAEPVAFHIVYLDPKNPDPRPPSRIVQDRWSCTPFNQRIAFTASTVAKIAKATDPRSSSLAVYHDDDGSLFIWGLIDQGNSYYDFVHYNVDSGPERPGFFQASIIGAGQIAVYRGYELLADYRVDTLRPDLLEVLERGPVHSALKSGLDRFVSSVRAAIPSDVYQARGHWDTSLQRDWLTALRRILLRIQQYRHGGAILITDSTADLNVKYELHYDRLRSCLYRRAVNTITCTHARDAIFEDYLEKGSKDIPTSLYLDQSVASTDLDDNCVEFDGVIWFISLLSRVDGLVLLTPDLGVSGFGVEIQTSTMPARVTKAKSASAAQSSLTEVDYFYFGTRHRSMMRHCGAHPGSVGFVISQDGDVRAMLKVKNDVVMWDNVKLRLDDFDRRRRRQPREALPLD